MRQVSIIGAGPAGATAAIAALQAGGSVQLVEKSRFPRHKVCGEFLSPEIAAVLEKRGVWGDLLSQHPAAIRRMSLYFRSCEKHCALPEAAWGFSRYRFDSLLLNRALSLGARQTGEVSSTPVVIAHGRKFTAPKGERLFGFKAHFHGPSHDAIELYFFDRCYVGINSVEDGITNICGLGPESVLKARDFQIDDLLASFTPLAQRINPLTRNFSWLMTGPLEFRNRFSAAIPEGEYPAGDALSFVDPFTGSGLLAAVATGSLAGEYAASGRSTREYLAACRSVLQSPFRVSSLLRSAIGSGWADKLVPFVPGSLLVRFTRPRVA